MSERTSNELVEVPKALIVQCFHFVNEYFQRDPSNVKNGELWRLLNHEITRPRAALEPCAECQRMREGLQLIATDEHRLMNITARQTAQSILNGKPSGATAQPPSALPALGDELVRALETLGSILNGHEARITPMQANALLLSHEQMSATIRTAQPPEPVRMKASEEAVFAKVAKSHAIDAGRLAQPPSVCRPRSPCDGLVEVAETEIHVILQCPRCGGCVNVQKERITPP
jgi:hypothetical protein